MKCPECQEEAPRLKQGVYHGKYISPRCPACFVGATYQRAKEIGSAQFSRDRQRDDYRKDIIQRYDGSKINPEFVEAYPEKAAEYFSEDELKQF